MKVPLSWLKEYVEIKVPVQELAHRLTMAGVEVAGIETVGGWENCYVGRVLEVVRHPNADKLTLCTVDIGSEMLRVVCGAPNVAAGQKICFARAGARLFSVHTGRQEVLKAARIRGVLSEGMICSERELGIGEDHTGIVVLDDEAPVGVPLDDYLGDAILDIEATPNRPDCLSVLGIAHEVAALTGVSVREPDISYPEAGAPIKSQVTIEVSDPDLCPRYTASLVAGITTGPSPRWIQERLRRAGQRPINNVVDITNYVMLEYGQPLHAFDYDAVGERMVIVRRAREGERLMTLDAVERQLTPDMLVIADAHDPIGLAGVMGGANSEMGALTKAVLLEAANFNAINNRATAQQLKLRTEASLRFEKALRPELAELGLRRATQLILELAGGTAARGIVDVWSGRREAPSLVLTEKRLTQVLGASIPMPRAQEVLESLGFQARLRGQETLEVVVPYWRSDITLEDNVVEEVARVIGYDNLPTGMLSTPIPHHTPQPVVEFREWVRDLLVACGLQEVITYPATSLESLGKAGVLEAGPPPVRIANPLGPEYAFLRTSLRPSLLKAVAANQRYREPLRLFEVGRVYLARESDLPEERETAAVVLAGPRWPTSWTASAEAVDLYDAKGAVEAVLRELAVQAAFRPCVERGFHPGKAAHMIVGNTTVGVLGEVHPSVLEAFDLEETPVALAELDLERLLEALPYRVRTYTPLPRFPTAVRDLSVIVDRNVAAASVEQVILKNRLVAQAVLFDVYEGPGVPPGHRSLAYRVHLQSPRGTLTTEQATGAMREMVEALGRQLGARLRE